MKIDISETYDTVKSFANTEYNFSGKVDYSELRHALVNKHWRKANEETVKVILKAANRNQQEYLRYEGS